MSDDSIKQEFLSELESIIESDEAYGSNIQVLTYALKEGVINGKFKDSWNNRVYEFIVDADGISYKPAARLDSFSEDELPLRFDSYSEGYASLFKSIRLDRSATGKRVKKPKCGKQGYGCGYSCISLLKTCQILISGHKAGTNQGKAIGQQRLNKLMELSKRLYLAGDKKGADLAGATAANISKVRTKYTGSGQASIAERVLTKQSKVSINPGKTTELPPNLEYDKEIHDVTFQQKHTSKTMSDIISLAQDVIAYVKNPLTFSQLEAKNKAVFLDQVATSNTVPYHENYEGNKKKIEAMSKSFLKMDLLYGNEAANVRAKGAKKLWDTLPESEQKSVASELIKIKSPLTNGIESNNYTNKYVIQLVDQIKKITK